MAPEDERDLIRITFTCEGNLHDPDFSDRFQSIVSKLKSILYTTKKKRLFQVRKIEPWNSVRVTISIPKEAAQRLRLLAQQGSNVLRQLGILSVQVEGDQVISLTLAGRYNEPQEVILRQSNNDNNSGTSPSTSSNSSLCSTSSSSSSSSSYSSPSCSTTTLSSSNSISSAVGVGGGAGGGSSLGTVVNSVAAASSSSSSTTTSIVPHAGPSGVMMSLDVLSSTSSAFRSPNVVAPGGESIPFPPKNSSSIGTRPQLGGPFPFASMTHAAHTVQRSETGSSSNNTNNNINNNNNNNTTLIPTIGSNTNANNSTNSISNHNNNNTCSNNSSSGSNNNVINNNNSLVIVSTSATTNSTTANPVVTSGILLPPPPPSPSTIRVTSTPSSSSSSSSSLATNVKVNPISPTTSSSQSSSTISAPVRNKNNNNNNSSSTVSNNTLNVVSKQPQSVLVTAVVNVNNNNNNNNSSQNINSAPNNNNSNDTSSSTSLNNNNPFIPPTNPPPPPNLVVVLNNNNNNNSSSVTNTNINFSKPTLVQGDAKLNPSSQLGVRNQQQLHHHSKQLLVKSSHHHSALLLKDNKEPTPPPGAQLTSSGKPRQFLINPLTGHLEPMPSESSSDSEGDEDDPLKGGKGTGGRGRGLKSKGSHHHHHHQLHYQQQLHIKSMTSKGKDNPTIIGWDKLSLNLPPPKPVKTQHHQQQQLDHLRFNSKLPMTPSTQPSLSTTTATPASPSASSSSTSNTGTSVNTTTAASLAKETIHVNNASPISTTTTASTSFPGDNKIKKIRLKLEKSELSTASYKMDVSYGKKSEKVSTLSSSNSSSSGSSNSGASSGGGSLVTVGGGSTSNPSTFISTSSASSASSTILSPSNQCSVQQQSTLTNSSSSVDVLVPPRVPPLHISLRGKNAAVVVSPRREDGNSNFPPPLSSVGGSNNSSSSSSSENIVVNPIKSTLSSSSSLAIKRTKIRLKSSGSEKESKKSVAGKHFTTSSRPSSSAATTTLRTPTPSSQEETVAGEEYEDPLKARLKSEESGKLSSEYGGHNYYNKTTLNTTNVSKPSTSASISDLISGNPSGVIAATASTATPTKTKKHRRKSELSSSSHQIFSSSSYTQPTHGENRGELNISSSSNINNNKTSTPLGLPNSSVTRTSSSPPPPPLSSSQLMKLLSQSQQRQVVKQEGEEGKETEETVNPLSSSQFNPSLLSLSSSSSSSKTITPEASLTSCDTSIRINIDRDPNTVSTSGGVLTSNVPESGGVTSIFSTSTSDDSSMMKTASPSSQQLSFARVQDKDNNTPKISPPPPPITNVEANQINSDFILNASDIPKIDQVLSTQLEITSTTIPQHSKLSLSKSPFNPSASSINKPVPDLISLPLPVSSSSTPTSASLSSSKSPLPSQQNVSSKSSSINTVELDKVTIASNTLTKSISSPAIPSTTTTTTITTTSVVPKQSAIASHLSSGLMKMSDKSGSSSSSSSSDGSFPSSRNPELHINVDMKTQSSSTGSFSSLSTSSTSILNQMLTGKKVQRVEESQTQQQYQQVANVKVPSSTSTLSEIKATGFLDIMQQKEVRKGEACGELDKNISITMPSTLKEHTVQLHSLPSKANIVKKDDNDTVVVADKLKLSVVSQPAQGSSINMDNSNSGSTNVNFIKQQQRVSSSELINSSHNIELGVKVQLKNDEHLHLLDANKMDIDDESNTSMKTSSETESCSSVKQIECLQARSDSSNTTMIENLGNISYENKPVLQESQLLLHDKSDNREVVGNKSSIPIMAAPNNTSSIMPSSCATISTTTLVSSSSTTNDNDNDNNVPMIVDSSSSSSSPLRLMTALSLPSSSVSVGIKQQISEDPSSHSSSSGGIPGEDSGIDSMDALSEKSPNQGESPARKNENDHQFCDNNNPASSHSLSSSAHSHSHNNNNIHLQQLHLEKTRSLSDQSSVSDDTETVMSAKSTMSTMESASVSTSDCGVVAPTSLEPSLPNTPIAGNANVVVDSRISNIKTSSDNNYKTTEKSQLKETEQEVNSGLCRNQVPSLISSLSDALPTANTTTIPATYSAITADQVSDINILSNIPQMLQDPFGGRSVVANENDNEKVKRINATYLREIGTESINLGNNASVLSSSLTTSAVVTTTTTTTAASFDNNKSKEILPNLPAATSSKTLSTFSSGDIGSEKTTINYPSIPSATQQQQQKEEVTQKGKMSSSSLLLFNKYPESHETASSLSKSIPESDKEEQQKIVTLPHKVELQSQDKMSVSAQKLSNDALVVQKIKQEDDNMKSSISTTTDVIKSEKSVSSVNLIEGEPVTKEDKDKVPMLKTINAVDIASNLGPEPISQNISLKSKPNESVLSSLSPKLSQPANILPFSSSGKTTDTFTSNKTKQEEEEEQQQQHLQQSAASSFSSPSLPKLNSNLMASTKIIVPDINKDNSKTISAKTLITTSSNVVYTAAINKVSADILSSTDMKNVPSFVDTKVHNPTETITSPVDTRTNLIPHDSLDNYKRTIIKPERDTDISTPRESNKSKNEDFSLNKRQEEEKDKNAEEKKNIIVSNCLPSSQQHLKNFIDDVNIKKSDKGSINISNAIGHYPGSDDSIKKQSMTDEKVQHIMMSEKLIQGRERSVDGVKTGSDSPPQPLSSSPMLMATSQRLNSQDITVPVPTITTDAGEKRGVGVVTKTKEDVAGSVPGLKTGKETSSKGGKMSSAPSLTSVISKIKSTMNIEDPEGKLDTSSILNRSQPISHAESSVPQNILYPSSKPSFPVPSSTEDEKEKGKYKPTTTTTRDQNHSSPSPSIVQSQIKEKEDNRDNKDDKDELQHADVKWMKGATSASESKICNIPEKLQIKTVGNTFNAGIPSSSSSLDVSSNSSSQASLKGNGSTSNTASSSTENKLSSSPSSSSSVIGARIISPLIRASFPAYEQQQPSLASDQPQQNILNRQSSKKEIKPNVSRNVIQVTTTATVSSTNKIPSTVPILASQCHPVTPISMNLNSSGTTGGILNTNNNNIVAGGPAAVYAIHSGNLPHHHYHASSPTAAIAVLPSGHKMVPIKLVSIPKQNQTQLQSIAGNNNTITTNSSTAIQVSNRSSPNILEPVSIVTSSRSSSPLLNATTGIKSKAGVAHGNSIQTSPLNLSSGISAASGGNLHFVPITVSSTSVTTSGGVSTTATTTNAGNPVKVLVSPHMKMQSNLLQSMMAKGQLVMTNQNLAAPIRVLRPQHVISSQIIQGQEPVIPKLKPAIVDNKTTRKMDASSKKVAPVANASSDGSTTTTTATPSTEVGGETNSIYEHGVQVIETGDANEDELFPFEADIIHDEKDLADVLADEEDTTEIRENGIGLETLDGPYDLSKSSTTSTMPTTATAAADITSNTSTNSHSRSSPDYRNFPTLRDETQNTNSTNSTTKSKSYGKNGNVKESSAGSATSLSTSNSSSSTTTVASSCVNNATDSDLDKIDSPLQVMRASSPLYTYSNRSTRNSHSTSASRSPSPPDVHHLHGEDQEIIDCLSRSPSQPKLSPQNKPLHLENDNDYGSPTKPELHHSDLNFGDDRSRSRSENNSSTQQQLEQLSIEIPPVDLMTTTSTSSTSSMSPATTETESRKSTRSTRSNTRLVSPDITAFRSDTPKPTKFTSKPDALLLRNSPKPSPTGSIKTHSPGLGGIQPSTSTRSSPVPTQLNINSSSGSTTTGLHAGVHLPAGRNSPNTIPWSSSSSTPGARGTAFVNKRKRQESDSSSNASKDENSEETKIDIDLNSRPGKRRCSENAAELIKACIGVEDTPKRNTSLIKKSEQQEMKNKEASGKGKKPVIMSVVVEENEEDLDSIDILSRGRGRSSRGSSEDRSSSRGSSVPCKSLAKEGEHKDAKANSRVNNRSISTKDMTGNPKMSGRESPSSIGKLEEKSAVGRRSNRNAPMKEKLTPLKTRTTIRKEPSVLSGTEKPITPSTSPENGNPRRKTRSSVAVGISDSSVSSFKRRRISKDAKS